MSSNLFPSSEEVTKTLKVWYPMKIRLPLKVELIEEKYIRHQLDAKYDYIRATYRLTLGAISQTFNLSTGKDHKTGHFKSCDIAEMKNQLNWQLKSILYSAIEISAQCARLLGLDLKTVLNDYDFGPATDLGQHNLEDLLKCAEQTN